MGSIFLTEAIASSLLSVNLHMVAFVSSSVICELISDTIIDFFSFFSFLFDLINT